MRQQLLTSPEYLIPNPKYLVHGLSKIHLLCISNINDLLWPILLYYFHFQSVFLFFLSEFILNLFLSGKLVKILDRQQEINTVNLYKIRQQGCQTLNYEA